jgi:hypothetical protein
MTFDKETFIDIMANDIPEKIKNLNHEEFEWKIFYQYNFSEEC